jgi:hypothetical protein
MFGFACQGGEMADLKKPLDQQALDALTLNTEEARAAYQEQRLRSGARFVTRASVRI